MLWSRPLPDIRFIPRSIFPTILEEMLKLLNGLETADRAPVTSPRQTLLSLRLRGNLVMRVGSSAVRRVFGGSCGFIRVRAGSVCRTFNMSGGSVSEVSSNKCFGGHVKVFSHKSSELKCDMKFAVFVPLQAASEKVPVLYWLSGLTCTEQNFITKGGVQKYAAEHGLLVVVMDTSPRGCNIEGEDESYDFGSGAGFYLDATEDKWKTNYRMFSYVTKELPALIQSNFPVLPDRQSITGHSMGGHGALICALKNPGMYRSVSAFAPICNPINCPWGKKAFSGYLGSNLETHKEYDACELVKNYQGPPIEFLIDQGNMDEFYPHQLLPENFVQACRDSICSVALRMHEGYDHSAYFLKTFMEDHVKHHAKHLKA